MAGIPASRTGTLLAVASSDRTRALALAAEAGNVVAYGDYAALLADPDVDAVYIATLHPQHADLIVASAEAGKHVLVEKPLTVTGAEAAAAVAAAADAGVVLVEAMMYRFQPQTECVRAALADGLIGTPLHVDVSCAFTTRFDPGDRLFDPSAGGGAILDVGCYAMSFARMVAGWTLGDDAVEPAELTAGMATWPIPELTTGPSQALSFMAALPRMCGREPAWLTIPRRASTAPRGTCTSRTPGHQEKEDMSPR